MLIYRNEIGCHKPSNHSIPLMNFKEIEDIKTKIDLKKKDQWYGYNSRAEDFANMFKEGIIDPTKVTRLALENAVSVAGTMLITEAVVSIDKTVDSKTPVDPAQQMLLG